MPPPPQSTQPLKRSAISLVFIRSLIRQAHRWAQHAIARSQLDPAYVVEKALAAIAFTLAFLARHRSQERFSQSPDAHSVGNSTIAAPDGAVVLALPTKLAGVCAVQPNVRILRDALRRGAVSSGLQLDLSVTPTGLIASWEGRALGRIQDKHAPWLLPLLPVHVSVHLIGVTGDEARGHTLGINVYIRLSAEF